jgi:hypothetical protein
VHAFALAASTASRRPIRGIPPSISVPTARAAILAARDKWHADNPSAPGPPSPTRRALAHPPAAPLQAPQPTPATSGTPPPGGAGSSAAPRARQGNAVGSRDPMYDPLPTHLERDARGKMRCRPFGNTGSCPRTSCSYSHDPPQ